MAALATFAVVVAFLLFVVGVIVLAGVAVLSWEKATDDRKPGWFRLRYRRRTVGVLVALFVVLAAGVTTMVSASQDDRPCITHSTYVSKGVTYRYCTQYAERVNP